MHRILWPFLSRWFRHSASRRPGGLRVAAATALWALALLVGAGAARAEGGVNLTTFELAKTDDGLQLTWLAPTDRFVELRAELGRGRSFPGSDSSRIGAGMAALAVHAGDDIGESHSWRAGLSYLRARASDQELLLAETAGAETVGAFSGRTGVWIADAVWKWAPNGNATRTNFKLQGEYLRGTREGSLVLDPAGAATPGNWRAVPTYG